MAVETEVAYHCSDDRGSQLRTSVASLLDAGSSIERVRVYLWRGDAGQLDLPDSKVEITPVEPLYGEFPYGNVVYSSWSDAPRVVYLDVDTIVLRPLDELWANRDAEVLARVGTAYVRPEWRHDVWEETFSRHGAPVVPMFNTGLVVFQHGVQRKLRDLWQQFTGAYISGEETAPWPDWRVSQQYALSLAVAVTGVSYELLSGKDHAFGWTHENYSEAVVLHTGNGRYAELTEELTHAGKLRERAS